ncbi:two-component system sensor histidine kinase CreC [Simiduia curdlanivorans]|uniref:histidine kinase n=1 Tax=Simiduia curdlanivorans TaxID=1492769 RepID=A0ABV8V6Y7_9GAMM|nr:two-component system sensor histidine kinase CreC [Simiduia curdlanivorans]MDN3638610.1 two-component system sensor histidine kinase CreC [Simiduia curdlanivorans]
MFLLYVIFMSIAGYVLVNSVLNEIKPAIRQTTEETLVDTANLLAEILRDPLKTNRLGDTALAEIFAAYGQRTLDANIWGVDKTSTNHRIYVTDDVGRVVFDSANQAAGQDYSRWNDVYLTLRGQYGARSSTEMFNGEPSSVMYIAAPIIDKGKIIGAVSVSKPNHTMEPFLQKARNRLILQSVLVITVGLLLGLLFTWWLTRELRRLRHYALAVSQGQRPALPIGKVTSGELNELACALESMRVELEGKAYVERYVQTLAHEVKCPLTAIRAATELLQSPMTEAERRRFIDNIDSESLRMQQMIERLLGLAKIEQQQGLNTRVAVDISELWQSILASQAARIIQAQLQLKNHLAEGLMVQGDPFLLRQAFTNLLDNALDFCPDAGQIEIFSQAQPGTLTLTITNTGPQIPEFALARLTERFYSLARPKTGKKSTGLGLNFVQEVAHLHAGSLSICNTGAGVAASILISTV